MGYPTLRAWLYNNPALDGAIMENIWGYKWKMSNRPHLDVVGANIENGNGILQVRIYSKNGKEIYNSKSRVEIQNNKFSMEFELKEPLVAPEIAEIIFIQGNKIVRAELPIKIHKIWGKVTNFEGNPIPAYLWAISEREVPIATKKGIDGTVVKADSFGNYELWLPEERIKCIFVADETYHKETFECWIWELTPSKDIKINPHIDKLEIYNLHAWLAYLDYSSAHIHFIPGSLARTLASLERYKDKRKSADILSSFPRLKRSDVKVYVGEEECEIKSFTEHLSYRKGVQPSYILDVDSKKFHTEDPIVRVVITHETKFKDKKVVEKGEAYFLGFCGRA